MHKKVAFEFETDGLNRERDGEIIKTVLTTGYPVEDYDYEVIKDVIHIHRITFTVNRFDLKDLRNDVEVLKRAGLSVREVEPL